MKTNVFKAAIAALVLAAGTQAHAQTEFMYIYSNGTLQSIQEVAPIDNVVFRIPLVLLVDKQSISVSSLAATDTIAITSNGSWTAAADSAWVTISPTSGNGNGTIVVNIAENVTVSEALTRNAAIRIQGSRDIFQGTIGTSISQNNAPPPPLPPPARKSSWLFDDASDLFKAENGGTALVPGTGTPAVFGGTAGFSAAAGPSAGNGAIHVNRGNFLKATHGIAPNGGGTMVNEYTIMWELKCAPEDKDMNYKSLLQTNENNTGDADWFMRPDYIGNALLPSSPAGSVQPEVWNRLVVSVKNGAFCSVYLNGVLISETPSGYRAIDDGRSSLLPSCLFFADEDGEDATWDVAEIAIWDVALSRRQVIGLEDELNSRP
ncbi:hypothetical protein FACS189456_0030 [Bacteroidia bacterium]|nr:hypothetical protein FACS189456_0030 [Bacteroidia bacterium]